MPHRTRVVLIASVALLLTSTWLLRRQAAGTGSVEGTVVDRRGAPVTAAWVVEDQRQPADAYPAHIGASAAERGDGSFRIEGLQPGDYRLELLAIAPGSNGTRLEDTTGDGDSIDVRAGETAAAHLVFATERSERIEVLVTLPGDFATPAPDVADLRLVAASGATLPIQAVSIPDLWPTSRFHFADVPPGSYTLEFAPQGRPAWRQHGVEPGQSVQIDLRGTGTLVVRAADAASGEVVPDFTVGALVPAGASQGTGAWASADGERQDVGRRLAGQLRHEGEALVASHLPCGSYQIKVHTDGFEDDVVPVQDLQPDERREVLLSLRRLANIAGVVVDPRGEPVANVPVGAFEPASREGASDRMFHTWATDWTWMQPGPWVHSEKFEATTDEHGAFLIEHVSWGRWIVRAWQSPTLDAVQRDVVVAGQAAVGGLRLVLPDACWIDGRLELPAGARCERMTAASTQMEGDEPVSFPMDDVEVAGGGTFRLGPFAPGEIGIWLKLQPDFQPSVSFSGQFDTASLELPRVSLVGSGDTVASFDLTRTFPAHVDVAARIDDRPAVGAWLHVVDAATGAYLATAQADAQGTARLGPFFATSARAVVSAADNMWSAYGEETVAPPANGVASLPVSVTLSSGRLQLLDEQGAPLVGEVVCLYHRAPVGWWQQFWRTDDLGGLTLTQPPHELRCLLVGREGEVMLPQEGMILQGVQFLDGPPWPAEPDETMPTVQWTTSGPQPAEVRLAPVAAHPR